MLQSALDCCKRDMARVPARCGFCDSNLQKLKVTSVRALAAMSAAINSASPPLVTPQTGHWQIHGQPAIPTAATSLGDLIGTTSTPHGSDAFLGIPYAKPPVGALRFAPAELHDTPWSLPRDATSFGAPCHQTAGVWDEDPGEQPQSPPFVPKPSEDCLFVNVWRPSAPQPSPTPVLVWIHGGGFCGGAASIKWYDGAKLAAQNNITVVSLNYRLGPLGFFASTELKSKYGATGGMNGLRDQLTALKWVKKHISSFGGDPSKVTVSGESSGGISVCLLNAAPEAKGLFDRAIIQSGPCIVPSSGWGPHTIQYGYAKSQKLMSLLNATSIDDLRKVAPQRLQWDNDTLGSDDFAGYFNDDYLLGRGKWPLDAYSRGELNAVNGMIIGHTTKDGTASFYGKSPLANATDDEWTKAMGRRWGVNATKVMAQYPLSRFANLSKVPAVTQAYIEADADNRVACPLRRMASLAASTSHPFPVFTYVFAHCMLQCDAGFEMKVISMDGPKPEFAGCGWASHGSDNKYVFGTTHGSDSLANPPFPRQDCPFDEGEAELTAFMGGKWAAFAKGEAPWWPFMAGGGTKTQKLEVGDATSKPLVDFKKDDCEFWG